VIYAVNTGISPIELVGAYRDSIRDVKSFMKAHKEVEELKIESKALSQNFFTEKFGEEELKDHKEAAAELRRRIKRLELEMEKNEVKELFDIGMYQAVVEDIDMYKLGGTNRVTDGMDMLTNKLPTIIRTPLQILYLSKETAWYRANQEILQLSDLVARDVMNRKQKLMEQRQADGKADLPLEYRKLVGRVDQRRRVLGKEEREKFLKIAKRSRHINLLDSFVNYNLPNGKGEEYLNRIGVLMFTKYLKRIQQVIANTSMQYPIRTLLTVTAAAFLFDPDKIQDQNLIVKGLDDNEMGLLGILPVYSPLDVVMNVVNPPLINLVTGY
jgi:hypothetical protein